MIGFEPKSLPPLEWRRSPNQSSRDGSRVRLIVPHTAEGSYKGTIAHFSNKSSEASSHLVLETDGSEATQMVGYGEKAWTQKHFNPVSESIECAGFIPNHSVKQMRVLARIVAFRLHENNLPCVWVRNSERFSGRGYTRHGDLCPEGGHCQCLIFTGWKWRAFRFLVGREFKRGHFRKEWGRQ